MATKKLTTDLMVSVVCIEPIRFNGKKYAPGSTLAGLTLLQAASLVTSNHAELVAEEAEEAAKAEGDGGDSDASVTPETKASAKK